MATTAGYSGTPLAKKLGFKAGSHAHLIYLHLLHLPAPSGWP